MALTMICQKLPQSTLVVIWILWALWEYVLGKTKFGSTVGLLIEAPINKLLAKLGIGNGAK
jgi:hypothetical protein